MASYIVAIGTATDVQSVEKSMRRAWLRDASNIWPSHLDRPRFNQGRIYGIIVEEGDRHDTYYVANADTLLRMMLLEHKTGYIHVDL